MIKYFNDNDTFFMTMIFFYEKTENFGRILGSLLVCYAIFK